MSAPLPAAVAAAVAQALGTPIRLSVLPGGTNRRTFLAEADVRRWVVRAEPAPALSLQRAIAAQMRAQRAGVRVPTTLADGLVNGDDQQYVWALETWHPGRAFDHDHTDTDAARAAIWDLGQQLRRLHTVTIDAFGDLPPRPYDVYPDFAAWLANKRRRVAAAMQLIAADAALEVAIDRIYAPASWHYTGSPRLCKGDCASDNLLVHDHQVTIIDWEWAQGLDPAADLAYWCRATPDLRAHRLLLEAYAPDDMPIVMRRMQLFNVVHAIETIHVLDEHRHAFSAAQRMAGFAAERRALQRILADS